MATDGESIRQRHDSEDEAAELSRRIEVITAVVASDADPFWNGSESFDEHVKRVAPQFR